MTRIDHGCIMCRRRASDRHSLSHESTEAVVPLCSPECKEKYAEMTVAVVEGEYDEFCQGGEV